MYVLCRLSCNPTRQQFPTIQALRNPACTKFSAYVIHTTVRCLSRQASSKQLQLQAAAGRENMMHSEGVPISAPRYLAEALLVPGRACCCCAPALALVLPAKKLLCLPAMSCATGMWVVWALPNQAHDTQATACTSSLAVSAFYDCFTTSHLRFAPDNPAETRAP